MMKRELKIIIILVGWISSSLTLAADAPAPFWHSKEKFRKRVFEDNEIVVDVAVQKPESSGAESKLIVQGAGVTLVPVDFFYRSAKDFSTYPQITDFVKSANYSAEKKRLAMFCEAFGYGVLLNSDIILSEAHPSEKGIHFSVVDGVFKGMKGVLKFVARPRRGAEISIEAEFSYNNLPMPVFFVEFGLEVAMKMAASRLRSYVEERYRLSTEAPDEQSRRQKSPAP